MRMRKWIMLQAALIVTCCSYGQMNFNFGNVTAEEATLTECAFDPEAVAAVLVDEGYSDYMDEYRLMTVFHQRIKILKEAGKKYAEVSLYYRSEDALESIVDVKAMVINFDEKGSRKDFEVDKKSIFRTKIDDRYSKVTFAFPEVKVGSILEYSYQVNAQHYGLLKDWYFQSELPVYRSSYNLKVVPTREISYLVQYSRKYPIKVEPNKNTSSIFFEMRNLPGLTEEPYMDARKDYIQKVIFQTTKYSAAFGTAKFMSNWNEVTRDLYARGDFGRQMKVNIDECSEFIKTNVADKPDYDKMRLIHHFVTENTNWDGTYGVVTKDGIKTLWKNRSGTAAEINLLLVNMLKDAGLDAYPMLVSERGHGRINKTTPFIDQFNSVYAAVIIDGKKYYLDGTDDYTPCYLIPYSILNSTAFIADHKNGGLVDINEKSARYRDIVNVDAFIGAEGSLKGTVHMLNKDYARAHWMRQYKNEKKEEYINQDLLDGTANISIDSFLVLNEDNDTLPFTQKFQFKTNVQNTGDYSFISLNMFSGYNKNPFILNNRFSNINFGYNKSLNENCIIHLPGNLKIDAIPKNITLTNTDGSVVFTRQVFEDEKNHQLVSRIKLDINKSLFTIDEYGELKEFFKKMIDLMNEQVVLKKI